MAEEDDFVVATPHSAEPASPAEDCAPCQVSAPTSSFTPEFCAGLNVKVPETSQFDDVVYLNKIKSVRLRSAQTIHIEWTYTTDAGAPIDISSCACDSNDSESMSASSAGSTLCDYKPYLFFRESGAGKCAQEIAGEIVDGPAGKVRFTIDAGSIGQGIFDAEAELVDNADVVYVANRFVIIVEPALRDSVQGRGLPDFSRIRTAMRDTDAGGNSLLGSLQFDDADIAIAASDCIHYWNEIPPRDQTYTTNNFPYQLQWQNGIIGRLYLAIAGYYRANYQQINAGGITAEDRNKERTYLETGVRNWKEFQHFVDREKFQQSTRRGWGFFETFPVGNGGW